MQHGEPVQYRTSAGEVLLSGSVVVSEEAGAPSGILCACCHTVISCSLFEAHAGRQLPSSRTLAPQSSAPTLPASYGTSAPAATLSSAAPSLRRMQVGNCPRAGLSLLNPVHQPCQPPMERHLHLTRPGTHLAGVWRRAGLASGALRLHLHHHRAVAAQGRRRDALQRGGPLPAAAAGRTGQRGWCRRQVTPLVRVLNTGTSAAALPSPGRHKWPEHQPAWRQVRGSDCGAGGDGRWLCAVRLPRLYARCLRRPHHAAVRPVRARVPHRLSALLRPRRPRRPARGCGSRSFCCAM